MRNEAEWGDELALALTAAREAASILEGRAGADRIREKGRADLVTDVDEAAERAIEARVRAAFPGDAFVAEEFSASERPGGRQWIVDPVDGTVNYVHGHPFACVSVAFADGSGPAVAVIDAPFLGEIYHAVRGRGAFLNGTPISVSRVGDASGALLATGFPFKAGKGEIEPYLRLVGRMVASTHGVRRAGAAALDLAYVAAGRVDGFFEIGLSPWDVAAGMLLVTEAGGTVSGWPGDSDPPLSTGRVIASNGTLHPWLAEQIGEFVPPL
ncbi:MAG: inositol monophosphatase family protein [Gemmatimonadota bacterium]